ncbi:hypothetical protein, variant 3 [Capsaspora owczarzaki ATCC 30864]|nr:hypothetical protein, variant 1 [Capsaspora owczarzaki ATCC 30864]KJE91181.1 hypothetical protein, variant 2 [Capsaspora owczarzaki ATCC 30864]KJE91182.1 hypothetical protein, variant 3 [Capsaspora owczarzaki ATCC 30864]
MDLPDWNQLIADFETVRDELEGKAAAPAPSLATQAPVARRSAADLLEAVLAEHQRGIANVAAMLSTPSDLPSANIASPAPEVLPPPAPVVEHVAPATTQQQQQQQQQPISLTEVKPQQPEEDIFESAEALLAAVNAMTSEDAAKMVAASMYTPAAAEISGIQLLGATHQQPEAPAAAQSIEQLAAPAVKSASAPLPADQSPPSGLADTNIDEMSEKEINLVIAHCERQIALEARIQSGLDTIITLSSADEDAEVRLENELRRTECLRRLSDLHARLSQCTARLRKLAVTSQMSPQQSGTEEPVLAAVSAPAAAAAVIVAVPVAETGVATQLDDDAATEVKTIVSATAPIAVEVQPISVDASQVEPHIDFTSRRLVSIEQTSVAEPVDASSTIESVSTVESASAVENASTIESAAPPSTLAVEPVPAMPSVAPTFTESAPPLLKEPAASISTFDVASQIASMAAAMLAESQAEQHAQQTAAATFAKTEQSTISSAVEPTLPVAGPTVPLVGVGLTRQAAVVEEAVDMDQLVADFLADSSWDVPAPASSTSSSSATATTVASTSISTEQVVATPLTQTTSAPTTSKNDNHEQPLVRTSTSVASLVSTFSGQRSPSITHLNGIASGKPDAVPSVSPNKEEIVRSAVSIASLTAKFNSNDAVAAAAMASAPRQRGNTETWKRASEISTTSVNASHPSDARKSVYLRSQSDNQALQSSGAGDASATVPSSEPAEVAASSEPLEPAEPFLKVSIPRAVLVDGGLSSMHTAFEIQVSTNLPFFLKNESTIQRRFSEFDWLLTKLTSMHGALPVQLPSKKTLGRFEPSFVEERRKALEAILCVLAANPLYQRERVLQLWLQSATSVSGMMAQLSFSTVDEDDSLRSAVSSMERGVSSENERQKLEDKSADHAVLSSLSVIRLKRILASEKLTAEGCFEKKDLVDRIWQHRNRTVDAKYGVAASVTPIPTQSTSSGKTASTDATASTQKKKPAPDADDVATKWSQIASWDATRLLHNIYTDVRPRIIQKKDPKKLTKVGWLDKQARGQSKISFGKLLKGWKKRWFTLADGSLLYYESDKHTRSLGFLRVRGGKVVARAGGLEVFDAAGRSVIIRMASDQFTPAHEDARNLREWQVALEKESKTTGMEENEYDEASAIIIDSGSADVKAGFALKAPHEPWPNSYFPTVVGVHKEAHLSNFVGMEALRPQNRPFCTLTSPFDPKASYSFEHMEEIWRQAFTQLGVDSAQHALIMTAPQFATMANKRAMAEIMFEKFGVPALYVQQQAVLSMYSYSQISGISVDVGERVDVVPIDEGYVLKQGMTQLQYGGKDITTYLGRLMSESGYRFFSGIESSINRYVKEKISYVSLDFSADLATASQYQEFTVGDQPETPAAESNASTSRQASLSRQASVASQAGGNRQSLFTGSSFDTTKLTDAPTVQSSPFETTLNLDRFNLPDGTQSVKIGSARFRCAEGLFNPLLFGKDNPGIHHLVAKAITATSVDMRRTMARNIYLSGGSTMFPGFPQRLEQELRVLMPNLASYIQVHAHENRKFAAFLGASVVAGLDTFDQMAIWSEDYEERGFDQIVTSNSAWA